MKWTRRDAIKYTSILTLILVVSIFHYQTSTDHRYLHEIYQRVYYIPISLAAFWYGPVWGFLAASLTSGIYIYHIQKDWAHFPIYSFNQYAEIILYHLVALVIGFLSRREHLERAKLEKTSDELAQAYAKLRQTFDQLRQADRLASLGQLSAGVAHEIRNPLGSIKGSIEILEKEIPAKHPKREFIDIIKEETDRLNSIVSEFLKFARPPQPSVESASVNDLIDSTLALLHKQAERARVEIRKKHDHSLPLVSVDRDQIRQVFLNVMLNGIQAMPEGGVLEVSSALNDRGDGGVAVEISDTGQGIADSNLNRIFDPFFTTKSSGTGLGLSISFQLLQSHGGRISVRKNSPRGLSFRIELPSAAPRQ